jgi:Skp family chaperone for outer membrane proteins
MKRQENQTLHEEFENFRRESYKDINARMVRSMRESLDLIVEVSRKLAREQGYDNVFDPSGNTNTGVPFLLYAKDAPDLSDDVKAALKDLAAREDAARNKSAETEPGESEASAGEPPSAPDQP